MTMGNHDESSTETEPSCIIQRRHPFWESIAGKRFGNRTGTRKAWRWIPTVASICLVLADVGLIGHSWLKG